MNGFVTRSKGDYFLYNSTSVLLLFSNCKVGTSLFLYEGGVCYQGEYFLHIGVSVVLLFFNCRIATSLFDHEGGLWQILSTELGYLSVKIVFDCVSYFIFIIIDLVKKFDYDGRND